MIGWLLRLWDRHLAFEPEATNWHAWREAVHRWRMSAEQQLQERASAAIRERGQA
jgi:hypothetical protein